MPENAAPDSTATGTGSTPSATTPPQPPAQCGAPARGRRAGVAPAAHPPASPAAPRPGEMSLYAAMLGESGPRSAGCSKA